MAAVVRALGFESYSISELMAQVDDHRLVIPPFQREVIWEQDRIVSLWDSMYRSYPIGSLLCWQTTQALDMTRAVGGAPLPPAPADQPADQPAAEYGYVLDGQQRLTAIYAGMKGRAARIAAQPNENYTLYFDATAGVSGLDSDGSAADALDLEADIFTGREDKPAQSPHFFFESRARERRKKLSEAGLPLSLIVQVSDPQALRTERLAALAANSAVPRAAIARLERLTHMLHDYRIPLTRVTGLGVADVCGVYLRINRFGRRLDPADVIMGAVFGAAAAGPDGFNLRQRFGEIRDALAVLNPRWQRYSDYRLFQLIGMCVRESLERANDNSATRFGVEPAKLLNLQPHIIYPLWPDIQRAIIATLSFLITEGIYDPGKIPGGYLPMALCAFMFRRGPLNATQRRLISQWLWRTAFQAQAMESASDVAAARRDFFAPLATGRTPAIAPLRIVKRDLLCRQDANSTIYKAMLGFLSHRGPRDFAHDGALVTYDPQHPDVFVDNDPTVHHICPKKFLSDLRPVTRPRPARGSRKRAEMYDAEALLNLCLLPGPTNRDIKSLSPAIYFRRYDRQQDFAAILAADLIPQAFAWRHFFAPKGYQEFLEDRYALFKSAMRALLPDVVLDWRESEPATR